MYPRDRARIGCETGIGEVIEFRVDKEKTINVLLFLIKEANGRGVRPSQYDLVKTIFLADRAHLNSYGRPITFDKYFAMSHGPVPSFAYDCLKPSFIWSAHNRSDAPWRSEKVGNKHRFSMGDSEADARKLSASDRKYLSDALTTVLSLGFKQVRRLTHDDPAYIAAWRDEEGTYAFPMDMGLLLDEADDAAIDDIRYLSEMIGA